MTIKERKEDSKLIISIEGSINTTTAPELHEFILAKLPGVKELELNFEKVDYISSAGLRVILTSQKLMDKQGKMVLSHVCKDVMEIFELTGFKNILHII